MPLTVTRSLRVLQSDIAQFVSHAHGYYCFSVQSGSKSFAIGFPSEHDAERWLEAIHEVAGAFIHPTFAYDHH